MPLEPVILASSLGPTEITGLAALSGLVVGGSFGLVYFVLKQAATERAAERAVREREAEAQRVSAEASKTSAEALRMAIDVLQQRRSG